VLLVWLVRHLLAAERAVQASRQQPAHIRGSEIALAHRRASLSSLMRAASSIDCPSLHATFFGFALFVPSCGTTLLATNELVAPRCLKPLSTNHALTRQTNSTRLIRLATRLVVGRNCFGIPKPPICRRAVIAKTAVRMEPITHPSVRRELRFRLLLSTGCAALHFAAFCFARKT
jgi:hypothetical protein